VFHVGAVAEGELLGVVAAADGDDSALVDLLGNLLNVQHVHTAAWVVRRGSGGNASMVGAAALGGGG